MQNTDNLKILAETALEGKNYDQAYLYYSQLLETDASVSEYWYLKGIASGWSSSAQLPRIEELLVCVKKAQDLDSTLPHAKIAEQVLDICDNYVSKLITAIDKEVNNEFDKKPMATGELYSVHQLGKLPIQLKVGNSYSVAFLAALKVIEYACELNGTAGNLQRAILLIDRFLKHSAANANYFSDHKDAGDRCDQTVAIRQQFIKLVQDRDPGFVASATPEKSGACFIATATLGKPDHPFLSTFYLFRNEVLLQSRVGTNLVAIYYHIGPKMASSISRSDLLCKLSYYGVIIPAFFIVSSILRLRGLKIRSI
jgi:hypothetical protein